MSRKRRGDFVEDEYDSSFEDEESDEVKEKKAKKSDLTEKDPAPNINPSGSAAKGLPTKEYFQRELTRAESYRNRYYSLNAYERHRKLINDYFLYHPGATADKLFQRDSSKDKRDIDIIRDNHRFLWDEDDEPSTWEQQLAKRYYDKLFKEYCICDLSRYKENKIAMRWRTEPELVEGKGQFTCGARKCANKEQLRTWEVNFAYMEESIKKNALVKLRLCPECSIKLNFGQKRREVIKKSKKYRGYASKKVKKERSRDKETGSSEQPGTSTDMKHAESLLKETGSESDPTKCTENIWKEPLMLPEAKSREEEFEDYLDDLFV